MEEVKNPKTLVAWIAVAAGAIFYALTGTQGAPPNDGFVRSLWEAALVTTIAGIAVVYAALLWASFRLAGTRPAIARQCAEWSLTLALLPPPVLALFHWTAGVRFAVPTVAAILACWAAAAFFSIRRAYAGARRAEIRRV